MGPFQANPPPPVQPDNPLDMPEKAPPSPYEEPEGPPGEPLDALRRTASAAADRCRRGGSPTGRPFPGLRDPVSSDLGGQVARGIDWA